MKYMYMVPIVLMPVLLAAIGICTTSAMFSIIGSIGSFAFAVCYLPQVINTYRTKSASGITMLLILLNIIGNVCSAGYVLYGDLMNGGWHYPLYANYGTALTLNILLLCMKVYYDRKRTSERMIAYTVHHYPAELPEITDGSHVNRHVFMLTMDDIKRPVSWQYGHVTLSYPIYGTNFRMEWGDSEVDWVYAEEILLKMQVNI